MGCELTREVLENVNVAIIFSDYSDVCPNHDENPPLLQYSPNVPVSCRYVFSA